jgi:hypothetical protein
MSDQFTVLAQHLSELEEQLEELNREKEKARQIVLDLLNEQNKTIVRTIFGNFTRCKGKTTTTYTSPEYLKAEKQLKLAKAKAKINEQFTIKTGNPYLMFER